MSVLLPKERIKGIYEQAQVDENNRRLAKRHTGIKDIDLGAKVRSNLEKNKNVLDERTRIQQESMNTPSESVPVIHFGKDGKINDKDILRAVPVFIINDWLKAKQDKSEDLAKSEKEIAEKEKTRQRI